MSNSNNNNVRNDRLLATQSTAVHNRFSPIKVPCKIEGLLECDLFTYYSLFSQKDRIEAYTCTEVYRKNILENALFTSR